MQVKINIPQLLFWLFGLYGFLLPFEFILEAWFGIDTIFKPYRIVNLVIIGIFSIQVARQGIRIRSDIREDIFLYGIFLYGLALSFLRMLTTSFHLGHFMNDLFQSGLYVLAFFIFKSLDLSDRQLLRIFQCFMLGLLINSGYMVYNFAVLGLVDRNPGFMDNPNYVALGLVALLSYCLLRMNELSKLRTQLLYTLLILFLLYVFIITGSRTGLVLLIIASALIFFFLSLRKKIGLLVGATALVLLLIPRDFKTLELGGPLILINRVTNSLYSDEEDVRFVIWRGTFQALEETGYLGMGIGQYKANFPAFFNNEPNKLILEVVNRGYHLSTHNDYLAILTDYGIVGLSLYLIFLFTSMRKKLGQLTAPIETPEQGFILRLSFVILSFMIIFGMAAENFQNQLFWFLLMFATKSPNTIPAPES